MWRLLVSKPMKRLSNPMRTRLKAAITRVTREQTNTLRSEVDADRRKSRMITSDLEEVRSRIEEVRSRFDDVGRAVTSLEAMRTRVEELTAAITSLTRESDRAILKITDLGVEVAAACDALDELAGRQGEVGYSERRFDEVMRELTTRVDVHRSTLGLILGPTGRYVSRFVSDDAVQALVSDFEFVGDRQRAIVAIHEACRSLVEIELCCVGRIAGATPNVIARLAAIPLVPPPSGQVLEIGTVLGVGAVGIARRVGIDVHLRIVDSFAGRRLQCHGDESLDASLSPVTQTVVHTNLALGGVPTDRDRLVEGSVRLSRSASGYRRSGLRADCDRWRSFRRGGIQRSPLGGDRRAARCARCARRLRRSGVAWRRGSVTWFGPIRRCAMLEPPRPPRSCVPLKGEWMMVAA
jgi:hypothetical protein